MAVNEWKQGSYNHVNLTRILFQKLSSDAVTNPHRPIRFSDARLALSAPRPDFAAVHFQA
jgi:hypothetical protein